MQDIVILEGRRTPFVRAHGRFQKFSNLRLATHSVKALVQDSGIDPAKIGALIYGHVVLDPRVPHLAREVVLQAKLPASVRAVSLNDNCISALSAAEYGVWMLQNTSREYAVIGGVESMSNPALMFSDGARRIFLDANFARSTGDRVKTFLRLRPRHFAPNAPGVKEPSTGKSMGEHCEEMVKQWQIAREAQDKVALASHQNAAHATQQGMLKDEIAPLDGLDHDDTIRADTTLAKLAKLRPAFDRSERGTITAGSSSPLTDGAASVLLATKEAAKRDGYTPLATIRDMEFAAIAPEEGLLMAPALAVPRLLRRNKLTLEDIDLLEIHEAFAGQVLCNIQAWENGWKEPAIGKVDFAKVNVSGGSIALGHPFAATGARIMTTLAHALKRSGKRYGLISICGAGATAGAFLLENAG